MGYNCQLSIPNVLFIWVQCLRILPGNFFGLSLIYWAGGLLVSLLSATQRHLSYRQCNQKFLHDSYLLSGEYQALLLGLVDTFVAILLSLKIIDYVEAARTLIRMHLTFHHYFADLSISWPHYHPNCSLSWFMPHQQLCGSEVLVSEKFITWLASHSFIGVMPREVTKTTATTPDKGVYVDKHLTARDCIREAWLHCRIG